MRHGRHRLLRPVTVLVLAGVPLLAPTASAVIGGDGIENRGFATRLDIGEGQRACSGALVDLDWVLTAASCSVPDPEAGLPAPSGTPPELVAATVGRPDLMSDAGHERTVVELVPHPDRDLMLARLDDGVTDVAPVPVATSAPSAGDDLEVLGFGRTATEWAPLHLHTGSFTIDAVVGAEMTLTGRDGAAVCAGDAGGPALRQAGTGVEVVDATFGYAPSEEQVATHLAAVHDGTRTIDQVEPFLLARSNYYELVGGTDAAYVTALYEHMFRRTPTESDLAVWLDRLPRMGLQGVVDTLWANSQAVRVRVVDTYEYYLGQAPTTDQADRWVTQLQTEPVPTEAPLRRAAVATARYAAYANARF
ncbi:trypsin [Promicromonospora sp. AC04]|uniref:S1 family peptidase n=1 Tax=Promicromonospora sp. AC04 TaxID=2135723 RepID=UPI000D4BEE8A|nr:S1 family peptidase [Promicromonospora sp. AC04]PUB26883.1 trypsin [Promicromonospora sp. AC04]